MVGDCRLGGGPSSFGKAGGGRKAAIDPRGVGVRVIGGVRVCFLVVSVYGLVSVAVSVDGVVLAVEVLGRLDQGDNWVVESRVVRHQQGASGSLGHVLQRHVPGLDVSLGNSHKPVPSLFRRGRR